MLPRNTKPALSVDEELAAMRDRAFRAELQRLVSAQVRAEIAHDLPELLADLGGGSPVPGRREPTLASTAYGVFGLVFVTFPMFMLFASIFLGVLFLGGWLAVLLVGSFA